MENKNKYPWTKAENTPSDDSFRDVEPILDLPEPPPAPPAGQTLEKPVYAGPEFFGKRRPYKAAEGVYADPEYVKIRPEPPVQAVYAAPRFDRRGEKLSTDRVFEGSKLKRSESETETLDVYAGPEYFGGLPDEPEEDASSVPEPQFMMVYAAPGFFPGENGRNKGGERDLKCERCGAPVKSEYNFCPECGASLLKKI